MHSIPSTNLASWRKNQFYVFFLFNLGEFYQVFLLESTIKKRISAILDERNHSCLFALMINSSEVWWQWALAIGRYHYIGRALTLTLDKYSIIPPPCIRIAEWCPSDGGCCWQRYRQQCSVGWMTNWWEGSVPLRKPCLRLFLCLSKLARLHWYRAAISINTNANKHQHADGIGSVPKSMIMTTSTATTPGSVDAERLQVRPPHRRSNWLHRSTILVID